MISERCKGCKAYPLGWCEYDALTDTVYPVDEGMCLIARRENMTGKTRKTIDYLKMLKKQ